ncbi:hypothetical protein R3X27_25075 [Tropicimonas sp. TH_r6]|uniref:hypothetical protein n=1 Tax=Tropicimonas sp. TH_r6 TaxID=3082085 RepID=UPI00295573E4|nr:hypothetical protein [Tropicimonas sp. TH_r6]MDV7145962.1 hypothetical protein [Tropicimonas sp. TH_r6]
MKRLSCHRTTPSNRFARSTAGPNLRRFAGAACVLSCVAALAGCGEPAPVGGISEPDPELVFVRGYRSAGDDCKLTGESAFTVDFLDDAADLVTCSTGSPDAATLVSETSASLVTQTNSYSLFSVPRR